MALAQRPATAWFLAGEEREWLQRRQDKEQALRQAELASSGKAWGAPSEQPLVINLGCNQFKDILSHAPLLVFLLSRLWYCGCTGVMDVVGFHMGPPHVTTIVLMALCCALQRLW